MDKQETNSSPENGLKDRNKALPFRISPRYYLYVIAAFTLIGVIGGYAYFYYVGCRTGSCAITSNPYVSMAWGGILGYLLPDFFVKKEPPKDAVE